MHSYMVEICSDLLLFESVACFNFFNLLFLLLLRTFAQFIFALVPTKLTYKMMFEKTVGSLRCLARV